MKLLQRYIGMTIIKLTLLVLLVVLGMEFFISIVSEVGDIGRGGYGLIQSLEFVVFSMPSNLYSLFPMIALIGSLLGLGALASHSELIVMRAAGFSVFNIIKAVLVAALILIVLVTAVGELVAPYTQRIANTEKLLAESQGQALSIKQGMWMRYQDNFIHINAVDRHLKLYGVTEFRFNSQFNLQKIMTAKTAVFINDQWWLDNGTESDFSKKGVNRVTFKKIKWPIVIDSKLLGLSRGQTQGMSLLALHRYITYQRSNGNSAASFALSFWQRVLQPLATLVMIFLAISFVFGPLRSVSMGARVVTGAVVGFGFYLLNQLFGPFSLVYQVPPIIGASLPILLFAIIAVLLMRRVR